MTVKYFEKLKDPRWQKKRLEALAASNWSCEQCGDAESTLHVHHKQYFKGREPWEYEVGQLSVLCEACHGVQHESEDLLLLVASFVPLDGPFSRDSTASLVAGFCGQAMDSRFVRSLDSYLAGEIAQLMDSWLLIEQMFKLVSAIKNRDKHTFRDAVDALILDLNTRPASTPPVRPEWFNEL